MSRRILFCLVCVLIAFPGLAMLPDPLAPANAVLLRLHWVGATQLPAGAQIACRARVVPLEPGAKVEPAETSVVVPGGGGQCALEIPLAWQGGIPGAVAVVYEMDLVSGAGVVARRTGSQVVAFPGAGRILGVDVRL